jgi:anti-sigma regulatory factor (Ser/Thr protein kinase)
VRQTPVHVGELVHGVLAKVDPLGRRRWTLDAAPDVVVPADRQRLTQALMQLAANAVTFTGERDVVALGAEVHDGALRIWVRDAGPGIDPAEHARIFERFGRATGSHGVEGSGLGLAIVAAIAEGHGGTVEVDSRLGRGSRFTVVLPAPGLPDTAPAEGIELGPGSGRETHPDRRGRGEGRLVRRPWTQSAGLHQRDRRRRPERADRDRHRRVRPRPARRRAARHGRLRGAAAGAQARAPPLVIILTARDSVTDMVAGLDGGADDYIAKPFQSDELLAGVRARLRQDNIPEDESLRCGDLSLDLRTRHAFIAARAVPLWEALVAG